jgi:S1-C subfamily serine protease
MKSYNRKQVILIAVATAVITALLALGFGIISFGANPRIENPSADSPRDASTADDGGFTLETNHSRIQTGIPAAGGGQPGPDEQENIRVYQQRNEAVVNITTETVSLNWFLEPVPRQGQSGSGSIIDSRGYVLTNHHVIDGAVTVYITLADGRRIEGRVIGSDPENDLAVLQFEPPESLELVTIPMGDSAALQVGQKVLAIGNPFGFARTLTTGIVSGLGRPLRAQNDLVIQNMIQTDASINPGNSGGPLLDSRGDMIGINTMIYSPTGGSVGIGFAVPVNTARRVVPDLIEFGTVRRGWIDATLIPLFPELVEYGNLPVSSGLLVSRIQDDGNAEQAGLRAGRESRAVRYGRTLIYLGGDIILEVDGTPVRTRANLYEALEDNRPGEVVSVLVQRGQRTITLDLRLSERPERMEWDS